jgi:hypothetical protein
MRPKLGDVSFCADRFGLDDEDGGLTCQEEKILEW